MSTVRKRQAATAADLDAQAAALALPAGSFKTLASTRAFLESIAEQVRRREIAPSQAREMTAAAALAVKLAELQIERDIYDLEVARLDDLAPRRRGGRS